jgi:Kdo2-lipid IVA lauroyltransferase/acyltransferase
LPLAWLHRIGAVIGWIVYWASPIYAARLRENLTASGIYTDRDALERAVKQNVAETGKGALEIAKIWLDDFDAVKGLLQCPAEAVELIDEAHEEGRGIIFLTPHLGAFEVTPIYASTRGPLTALYRPPRLAWLGELMMRGRNRGRSTVVPTTLKGVRALYKALQRGEGVGLLPDQAPHYGEGVWADFFGRPAYTITLVRRLRKQTGAAVIFLFAERLPDARGYLIHAERYRGDDLDEREMNRMVEDLVRRCPEQYLWSYNRYKVPAGAPKPIAGAQT